MFHHWQRVYSGDPSANRPASDLPVIEYPFVSKLNPFLTRAHLHSLEWINKLGLLSPRKLDDFAGHKFSSLAARAYPTAPLAELCLAAEWNIWLFAQDDLNDELGIARRPAQLEELYDRFRRVLSGVAPAHGDGAFATALWDLWQRMFARSSARWRERFVRSVDEYFHACVWEAENRAKRRVPSVADYTSMRRLAGVLATNIELIEICEHIQLPESVYGHPVVQRLTLASTNVVCWANDIFSLANERRSGDVHKLVLMLERECGLDWQGAVERAHQMHDAELRLFLELERTLPRFGAPVASELERYTEILRAWMRANLDWARETGRYKSVEPRPSGFREILGGPVSERIGKQSSA